MDVIRIKPIFCTSNIEHCNCCEYNNLIVGTCDRFYYTSNLVFKPITLYNDAYIKKAELFLYCEDICGCNSCNINVEKDHISNTIFGVNWYNWNVSEIFKNSHTSSINLCLYSNGFANYGICKFSTINSINQPYIELTIDKEEHHNQNEINIIEEYSTNDLYNYTSWFKCLDISSYFYFIKNIGNSAVEINVQISPDKINTFIDNGPFVIKPMETQSIIPLRVSYYVRLSFKNAIQFNNSRIKVWLQGIKNNL